MRTIVLNLVVTLLALLLLALGLEAGLRVFAPQIPIMPDGIYAGHPQLRYLPNPGAVGRYRTTEFDHQITINAHGFRGQARPLSKPAGVFRVLCLGDSFTLGAEAPLEQTYPAVLEELLNRRAEGDSMVFEVVNAGVGGYGTYQELIFIHLVGLAVQPDLVVVQFFSNDVRDNISFEKFLIDSGQDSLIAAFGMGTTRFEKMTMPGPGQDIPLHRLAMPGLPVGMPPALLAEGKAFLSAHSHVYHLLRARIAILKSVLGLTPITAFDDLAVMSDPPSSEVEAGWALTERLYLRMRDLLAERGIRMVIVVVPNKAQVGEDGRYDAWIKQHRLDLTKPRRRLLAFGEMAGIPVLDLQPPFEATGRGQDLYYRWDGHWNAEGAHAAAAAIAEFLTARSLAPGG